MHYQPSSETESGHAALPVNHDKGTVVDKKYRAEVRFDDDGAMHVAGTLPSSYLLPGNSGHALYSAVDAGEGPLQQLNLSREHRERLGPHCGVEYELVIRPMRLIGSES